MEPMRPFQFFRHVFWFGLGVWACVSIGASLSILFGDIFTVHGHVDDGTFFVMMCLGWAFMGLLFGSIFAGWLQWRSRRDRDLLWFVSFIAGLLYVPFVTGGVAVALRITGQDQGSIIGTMVMVLVFGTPFLLAELQSNIGRMLFGQRMRPCRPRNNQRDRTCRAVESPPRPRQRRLTP